MNGDDDGDIDQRERKQKQLKEWTNINQGLKMQKANKNNIFSN